MSSSVLNSFYDANANLFERFGYHAVLGLKRDIGPREDCPQNVLEKIGDAGLWTIEELPQKISKLFTDPRVVTVAVTALALVATSFVFYPINSWLAAKAIVAALPFPPAWAVRFASYILTVSVILAASCRAQGRFWNNELMQKFYAPQPARV